MKRALLAACLVVLSLGASAATVRVHQVWTSPGQQDRSGCDVLVYCEAHSDRAWHTVPSKDSATWTLDARLPAAWMGLPWVVYSQDFGWALASRWAPRQKGPQTLTWVPMPVPSHRAMRGVGGMMTLNIPALPAALVRRVLVLRNGVPEPAARARDLGTIREPTTVGLEIDLVGTPYKRYLLSPEITIPPDSPGDSA